MLLDSWGVILHAPLSTGMSFISAIKLHLCIAITDFVLFSVFRRCMEEPCLWVETNNTTISLLCSNAEITLGFLMIVSLFSYVHSLLAELFRKVFWIWTHISAMIAFSCRWKRNIIQTFMYFHVSCPCPKQAFFHLCFVCAFMSLRTWGHYRLNICILLVVLPPHASTETLGSYAVHSQLYCQTNFSVHMYFVQLLKLMYHAPVTSGYHQSVWARIGRAVNPHIHRYTPFLNTPISVVQRWWLR